MIHLKKKDCYYSSERERAFDKILEKQLMKTQEYLKYPMCTFYPGKFFDYSF